MFRKVDCIQIPVPDLEAGLAFYRDRLGHALNWRTDTAAGLRLPDTDAEIVLQTERPEPETDLLVDSADAAVRTFVEVGGSVVVPPFDIPVGRCAVVADPWGNRLVLLDLSKGLFVTEPDGSVRRDASGNPIVATAPREESPDKSTRAGPVTEDDPLWKLVGIGESIEPTDIATNKHAYVVEAYGDLHQSE